MKVLFIGGTGNISSAVSELAVQRGIELWHLNRGQQALFPLPAGVRTIHADIRNPVEAADALKGHEWDSVVNWITFTPEQAKIDIDLFRGKTKQFIFISSASAYQTPPDSPFITEETPLDNPFWEYSRNKIACEKLFLSAKDFPATVVRPSHTYNTVIPTGPGSWDYAVVRRLKAGGPAVIHGDGTSLWVVTHSQDFAKGFIGLLGREDAIGEAFHITTDEVLSWNQIYSTIAEVFGCNPNFVHIPSDFIAKIDPEFNGPSLLGDKMHSVIFDNSKIKRFEPDFKATISFRDGLGMVREWYDADPKRKESGPWALKVEAALDHVLAAWRNV
jgi:nucleoside-diphosphate-sugar epimerase